MRQIAMSVVVMLATVVAMAAPPQLVIFTDEEDAVTIQARALSGGTVDAGGWTTGSGAAVREAFAHRSPDRSTIAVGLLDDSGNLTVRPFTDNGFGPEVTVATGVSVTRPAPVAAAYASRVGRLVIAYAATGSSECLVRTYDGSVSIASSAPLGLSSTPVRVMVAPSPSSDDVLIVAQDSSQRLAVTIWDGTDFRATELLDSSYDGGTDRWDATWSRSNGPMVAWARASDTTLRVRRLDGDTWDPMDSTPVAPGAIGRIILTADSARGQSGVAAAIVSGAGRLEVFTLDAGAWSMATLMTAALEDEADQPVGLSHEGHGGGLLCAWLDADSDRVHLRRRAPGGAWGVSTTTDELGDGLTQILLVAHEDEPEVVVLARQETGSAGGSSGVSDYSLYAQGSTISLGDRTVVNGQQGSQVQDVELPDVPEGSPGATNVSVNHDQTQTLAPGSYRDLSFGDRTRINFSAGTYIFRRLSNSGHDARFVCDTSAGDVVIVFNQSTVQFRDRFRIERNGAGVVSVHTKGDSLRVGHDCNIEAVMLSHGGSIHFGDRTRLTGHVFASTSIYIGHDSVISVASWPLPALLGGGGGASSAQRIHGLVVSSGSPGTPADLTPDAIDGDTPPPLAISAPPIQSSTRIVRWREVAPE